MRALLLLVVAACNPDSMAIDARPAQSSLTITGHVTAGGAAAPGVTVGAYRNSVAEPVAMTATDANGDYVMPVMTAGEPIDYVGATLTSFVPTHLYLPEEIREDAIANIDLAREEDLEAIALDTCSTTLTLTVEVQAQTSAGEPRLDATVSSVPPPRRYCSAMNETYLLGLTGGIVISATASSGVYKSRTIIAQFQTLTVAIVRP